MSRQLDAEIAEKVMGSKTVRSCTTGQVNEWVPKYSTSPDAAMKVVEKMRELGWNQFQCVQMPYGGWEATFWYPGRD
jgi:hypothetical protein